MIDMQRFMWDPSFRFQNILDEHRRRIRVDGILA